MKNNKLLKDIMKIICCLAIIISQFSSFERLVIAEDTEPKVTITLNGSRILSKIENIDSPSYSWQIADSEVGPFKEIDTNSYYDITTNDEGKYVKLVVGEHESNTIASLPKLITFDLEKSAITLGTSYSGKDSEGNIVSGTHTVNQVYVIKQSNNASLTENIISFTGNTASIPYDVTLDGVNMGQKAAYGVKTPDEHGNAKYTTGSIDIPATNTIAKNVILRLKNENIIRAIHYYTSSGSNASSLKITDIKGDGSTESKLYMPVKVAPENIDEFVNTNTNYNHWNSVIGGDDNSSEVYGLEIAGGSLQILSTLGDNCTAIGAGGNGSTNLKITGGNIIAHCNGTGTAIGGGIGWHSAGGSSKVTISGGKIYAKNHGEINSSSDGTVGGVAIGAGSSFKAAGSTSTITITGGEIEAYGTFGNGIGGGNSSTSTGGSATVTITGGIVHATSIGGGNSKVGTGGSATVIIDDSANVTLSDGIGGGLSKSGTGGRAEITINNGFLNCGGIIGGGNGTGKGNGGEATVIVNNGNLIAKSIGGGTGGTLGNGGAANIIINGGTIVTGSIGGGNTLNPNGNLGYAKAKITGGDISGQFLMAAAGDKQCSFEMTGGLLHGVDTTVTSGPYQYSQSNGAAVYMNDPIGVAILSGGKIENCKAVNGGAVYMTDGTFTISNEGIIEDCEATDTGGAVYLGGGTLNVKGGIIQNNNAINGGGIYLNNGTLNATGGTITKNEASVLGGGALVNGGTVHMCGTNVTYNTATDSGGGIAVINGNYNMAGGSVDNNTASNNTGGGVYVSSDGADVDVNIYSGSISGNRAALSGGAVSVIGPSIGENSIDVQIGVNEQHFVSQHNPQEQELTPINCDHDYIADDYHIYSCPQINNNVTGLNGGAVFVTGNSNTELKMFCLEEKGNSVENLYDDLSYFMKVEGGRVLMSTIPLDQIRDDMAEDEIRNLEHNSTYGNIQVENTIHATGGKIDIYGKMTNPKTSGIITVDMVNKTDKFVDHRYEVEFYKLHYYENFTDPVTNITTGQYKAYSISINSSVEIKGNIYEHPGYTIVGWNTAPDGSHDGYDIDDENGTDGWYRVGDTYKFDGKPLGSLTIYAIWKANGYKVYFNSNIPENTPYEGDMEEYQIFEIDKEDNLYSNKWIYPGYNFKEWNTKKDGTGKTYTDGQLVKNITSEDSITLYAQWEKCDHSTTSGHEYVYSIINNGKTIQAECECKGYKEYITINGKDTIYDRSEHPATLTKTNTDALVTMSLFDNVSISYTYQNLDNGNINVIDGSPKNAGIYVASITAGGKTASVTYTISKSPQHAPNKPDYVITNEDGKTAISVKHVNSSEYANDETYDSKKQYKLVYYINGERTDTGWQDGSDDDPNYGYIFDLNVALTNYYVYARYSEGSNYLASSEIPADSSYFFGEVEVVVSCGEGIVYDLQIADGKTITDDGITLKIKLLDDTYYYPTDFTVIQKTVLEGVESNQTLMTTVAQNSEYKLSNIPDKSKVTITIPDAKKYVTIDGKVTEKEIFGRVTTDEANISRDSAYTASFEVNNYDSNEYQELSIAFDPALPENTSIIMKDQVTNKYYWIKLDSSVDHISLESFKRMGTNNIPYTSNTGNLKLLFAVDFSETDTIPNDSVTTTISAVKNSSSNVETKCVNTNLFDKGSYELTTHLDGLTKQIQYKTNVSEGVASILDNRNTSILLKPKTETPVPVDSYIIFKTGNTTLVSYANEEGYYVAPLSAVGNGSLTATLVSKLFPSTETSYEFEVDWRISDSRASISPINGDSLTKTKIEFTTGSTTIPSVKIHGEKNLFTIGEYNNGSFTMNSEVTFKNLNNTYNAELILMRKADSGNYTNTGWSQSINLNNEVQQTHFVNVNLAGQEPGSFMIQIVIKSGIDVITKANYYFIIQ